MWVAATLTLMTHTKPPSTPTTTQEDASSAPTHPLISSQPSFPPPPPPLPPQLSPSLRTTRIIGCNLHFKHAHAFLPFLLVVQPCIHLVPFLPPPSISLYCPISHYSELSRRTSPARPFLKHPFHHYPTARVPHSLKVPSPSSPSPSLLLSLAPSLPPSKTLSLLFPRVPNSRHSLPWSVIRPITPPPLSLL